jgi:hypothetical protein
MKFIESIKQILPWILHRRPSFYGLLYLSNIVLFSIIYSLLFSSDFKTDSKIGFIQSFYFSVVTVTTLGFGDIAPKLDSQGLLLTIVTQVLTGVILIGLFLNSLSQKISDIKDSQLKKESERERKRQIAKIMVILKPIIMRQLETLTECYKVTSQHEKEPFNIRPVDLFTEEYFDQMALINYHSKKTKYGDGKFLGHHLSEENKIFQNDLDSFLTKFSHALSIDTVKIINDLQNHRFFTYPTTSMMIYQHQVNINHSDIRPQHIISLEHSTRESANAPKYMREYHALLIEMIEEIEQYLPDEKIEMSIYLKNHISPPVGSAIGEILYFGNEQ